MSNEIKQVVRKLAGTDNWDKHTTILCKVNTIDLNSRSCSVLPIGGDASAEIFDVQLMANVNDGLLLVPILGSEVYVTYTVRKLFFVSFFSELDTVFLITKTLTQLNDGSFGGLIKIADLVSKLNNAVSEINAQLLAIQAGIIGAGGTYTPQDISNFLRTDFENPLITHGK